MKIAAENQETTKTTRQVRLPQPRPGHP